MIKIVDITRSELLIDHHISAIHFPMLTQFLLYSNG